VRGLASGRTEGVRTKAAARSMIAAAAVVLGSLFGAAQAQDPPNILIILADDLGHGDVGYLGAPDIETPNIDALAASGVIFGNGLVNSPTCGPSRAGLLTGRYASRFGVDINWPAYTPDDPHNGLPTSATSDLPGAPEGQETIAQLLSETYRTGVVGKWHLGAGVGLRPGKRGFEYSYGFLSGSHDYWKADDPADEPFTSKMLENNEEVDIECDQEEDPNCAYLTYVFSRKAVEFVKQQPEPGDPDEPFFLFL